MTKLLAKIRDIYFNLLLWRIKHISDKNFVIILGGVVGIVAGIAAVALKSVVHFIQGFLTGGFAVNYANILHFIYPLVGIVLTVLLAKYLFKESLGHGITSILFAISKNSSIIGRNRGIDIYCRLSWWQDRIVCYHFLFEAKNKNPVYPTGAKERYRSCSLVGQGIYKRRKRDPNNARR